MKLIISTSRDGKANPNDVLLQELVNNGNFKQALVNCEKRIKKREKTSTLEINKALILCKHPDPSRQEQGQKDLVSLVNAKDPITDIDWLCTLELFSAELKSELLRNEISATWPKACDGRKNDLKLHETWFDLKFRSYDYKAAQQAANVWARNFPKSRTPWIRSILCGFLVVLFKDVSAKDAEFLSLLTYRQCRKAYDDLAKKVFGHGALSMTNVVTDLRNDDGVRHFRSVEEIEFFCLVLCHQGRFREALDVLSDDAICGCRSVMCRSSFSLLKTKTELASDLRDWLPLWQICLDALNDSLYHYRKDQDYTPLMNLRASGDDLRIWDHLLTAGEALGDTSKTALIHSLVDTFSQLKSQNAIAIRSKLQLSAVEAREAEILGKVHSLIDPESTGRSSADVEAFITGFLNVASHPNVEAFVNKLDLGELRNRVLKLRASVEESSAKHRKLELRRLLEFCKAVYRSVATCPRSFKHQLAWLQARFLQLYEVYRCLTPHRPEKVGARGFADEAMVLASLCAVHLSSTVSEQNQALHLMRAAFILEVLTEDSPHNYDAVLLLTKIYEYFGLFANAISHSFRVELKNILYWSNWRTILARISTLNPAEIGMAKTGNKWASIELQDTIDWMVGSSESCDRVVNLCLENGTWINLIEELKRKRMTRSSVSLQILLCQLIRLQQIDTGEEQTIDPQRYVEMLGDLPAEPTSQLDNQRIEDPPGTICIGDGSSIPVAPKAGPNYLDLQIALIVTDQILSTRPIPKSLLVRVMEINNDVDDLKDLTKTEKSLRKAIISLAQFVQVVILHIKQKRALPQSAIDSLNATCASLNGELLHLNSDGNQSLYENDTGVMSFPTWQYFHSLNLRRQVQAQFIRLHRFLVAHAGVLVSRQEVQGTWRDRVDKWQEGLNSFEASARTRHHAWLVAFNKQVENTLDRPTKQDYFLSFLFDKDAELGMPLAEDEVAVGDALVRILDTNPAEDGAGGLELIHRISVGLKKGWEAAMTMKRPR